MNNIAPTRPGARHRRTVIPSALALVVVIAGLLLAPLPAAASDPGRWHAVGPGASVTSDGSTSPASFSYAVGDLKQKSAGWLFISKAPATADLTIPWHWTGDHGRTKVRSTLTTGVYRDGDFHQIATLVDDGPRDCCADGSTGFSYSGTTRLSVHAGDWFGFLLTGSHDEKSGPLRGSFALAPDPTAPRPVVTVPDQPVTALLDDEESSTAVTYAVTASDPVDGALVPDCTPASGAQFGAGDTTVTCTATSSRGLSTTATFIVRVFVDEPNLTWPTAKTLSPTDEVRGTLRLAGMGLWYRVPVQPDSTLQVDLTQLAANFDVTVFGDIGTAFVDALTPQDLNRLTAEFAADAFSPSAFSPSAFSPSAFSPSAFSPSAFSPSAFSPSAFSPSAFSPSAFSPSAFSPSAFSPSAFSPSAFSPSAFSPSAFSPSAFSPSAFSDDQIRDAYSSAQTRSLIAVSARDGLADESVQVSTWDTTGYFYIRVQGRNGAFAPGKPFRLSVGTTGGACDEPLHTYTDLETFTGSPGGARTIVLTDSDRLPGAPLARLRAFADRPEIGGVVVDAAAIPRLRALNAQADEQTACPYAKNLVARALRDIVNSYRDGTGTLSYVVLAGDDSVIPFFRNADAAGLGPEQGYVPPVADRTSSQAALRRNQVLSQDAYGAVVDVRLKGATVAVPDVAVGRLVETRDEIIDALDRYVALDGRLPTPRTALVTGYDFLTDGADEVSATLSAGLGSGAVTDLITDADVPPTTRTQPGGPDRRHSWTSADLRRAWLGNPTGAEPDIVYLAGHFSANSALAADYESSLLTTDVRDAAADLTDTLILSAGCHSGYNIVDPHGVPGLTERLDWPQVMADKGAILVAGTGYQYGDTDFVEYSERLYAGLAHQLRVGTDPVPLGAALVRAKQDYLATTPVLSGIHQKALAEATLYGLPMLTLDLPSGRIPAPDPSGIAPDPVTTGPGAVLGLRSALVTAQGATTMVTKDFTDPDGTGLERFTYLRGPDGTTTSPGQPALPVQSLPVGVDGYALRGVGFRGGAYSDVPGIVPLTGAPATETHEVHTAFSSPVFFPRRLALANTYGAIAGDGGTRLLVTPAQHRSDSPFTSTLRRYSSTDYQLLYSNNTQRYGANLPALAGPPEIVGVASTVTGSRVDVTVDVVGDPSAGIQQAWITRTADAGPWYGAWRSLDLTQSPSVSTRWTGSLDLPAGQRADDVRFIVQAANGVGQVSLDDNQGHEYVPGTSPGHDPVPVATAASSIDVGAAASGTFGSTLPVTATLSSDGQGLPGARVRLSLGTTSKTVVTDEEGVARASFALVQQVGQHTLSAAFDGDERALPSSSQRGVEITKRPTTLTLLGPDAPVLAGEDTGVVAELSAGTSPVTERSVLFVVRQGEQVVAAAARTTHPDGRASLGTLALPSGHFSVTAYFGSDQVDVGGGSTAGAEDPQNLASTSEPVPLRIVTPPRILTESLPQARAGEAFDAALEVSGDPTPEVTVTGLPPGLDFTDGRIRGTTTRAGNHDLTVRATSSAGTDRRDLVLVVRPGPAAHVAISSGNRQSTEFGTTFAPIAALVTDEFANPVPGAEVTFTSPGSSTAAGTDPAVLVATSGPEGLARITPRANSVVGAYDVVASTGAAAPATFRLANAYRVSAFGAPLDQPEPVVVGPHDVVRVTFGLSDASGPISDTAALRLVTACRVTFSSTAEGGTAETGKAPPCVQYGMSPRRFHYTASGTLLGWTSGRTYVLAVQVAGEQAGDLLGSRTVRVRIR